MRTCHIEPKALMSAQDWIGSQRASWEARFNRLDDYLKNFKPRRRNVAAGNDIAHAMTVDARPVNR